MSPIKLGFAAMSQPPLLLSNRPASSGRSITTPRAEQRERNSPATPKGGLGGILVGVDGGTTGYLEGVHVTLDGKIAGGAHHRRHIDCGRLGADLGPSSPANGHGQQGEDSNGVDASVASAKLGSGLAGHGCIPLFVVREPINSAGLAGDV
jgi:hypothetical protein